MNPLALGALVVLVVGLAAWVLARRRRARRWLDTLADVLDLTQEAQSEAERGGKE